MSEILLAMRIKYFLAEVGHLLWNYWEEFTEMGYAHAHQLINVPKTKLHQQVCNELFLGEVAFEALWKAIKALPVVATPAPVPTVPTVPTGPTGPTGPTERAPTASNVAVVKSPETYTGLKLFYRSVEQLKVDTYKHSSIQGCSCMRDNKRSGSRCVIFGCRTNLSKKRQFQEDTSGPPCLYRMVWRKRKGLWYLCEGDSHVYHKEFCHSGQITRQVELKVSKDFAKSIQNSRRNTAKYAMKQALELAGKMAGSVSAHVARRAKNHVLNQSACYYADDFCKMKKWARDFQELNPGSKAEVDVDEQGRYVCLCARALHPPPLDPLGPWAHGPKVGPKWAHGPTGAHHEPRFAPHV